MLGYIYISVLVDEVFILYDLYMYISIHIYHVEQVLPPTYLPYPTLTCQDPLLADNHSSSH